MNNLTIIGRIVKNAETKTVKVSGIDTLVTSFTVAANEGYGENQTTEFFRITVWRDRGAKMAPHLVKGRLIAAKGEVSASAWVDKDDPTKAHYQLELKNAKVQFVDKKPDDPEEEPAEGEDKPF